MSECCTARSAMLLQLMTANDNFVSRLKVMQQAACDEAAQCSVICALHLVHIIRSIIVSVAACEA